jgi:phosphonate C-P lyase system protein PhnG
LSDEQVDNLLRTFDNLDIKEIENPQTGLIMINANDSFDSCFYLGEMLVAVCEVEFDGIRGHATVMGDDSRRAFLASIISALSRHKDSARLLAPFCKEFMKCANSVEAEQMLEKKIVASTKVKFDSMAPEDM